MAAQTKSPLPPLTAERVLDLWSRTYNTQGKPDWSHIFPYYHEEIIFQDTVQRIEGKTPFLEMCNRLTERCEQLEMDIRDIAVNDNVIFMEWIMTMIFRKTPSTPLRGCTKLTLGPDGRITHQRDYYDLWGDIFDNIPRFGGMYRKFMHRKFG